MLGDGIASKKDEVSNENSDCPRLIRENESCWHNKEQGRREKRHLCLHLSQSVQCFCWRYVLPCCEIYWRINASAFKKDKFRLCWFLWHPIRHSLGQTIKSYRFVWSQMLFVNSNGAPWIFRIITGLQKDDIFANFPCFVVATLHPLPRSVFFTPRVNRLGQQEWRWNKQCQKYWSLGLLWTPNSSWFCFQHSWEIPWRKNIVTATHSTKIEWTGGWNGS